MMRSHMILASGDARTFTIFSVHNEKTKKWSYWAASRKIKQCWIIKPIGERFSFSFNCDLMNTHVAQTHTNTHTKNVKKNKFDSEFCYWPKTAGWCYGLSGEKWHCCWYSCSCSRSKWWVWKRKLFSQVHKWYSLIVLEIVRWRSHCRRLFLIPIELSIFHKYSNEGLYHRLSYMHRCKEREKKQLSNEFGWIIREKVRMRNIRTLRFLVAFPLAASTNLIYFIFINFCWLY